MNKTSKYNFYLISILIFASIILSASVIAGPLSNAVKSGDIEKVKSLIAEGLDINKEVVYGSSALHGAVIKGRYEIAKILISNGADVNAKDKKYQSTPLHLAAYFGNEKIVRLLLDNGANLLVKDQDGDTPIDAALANKHHKIAKLMKKFLSADSVIQNDAVQYQKVQLIEFTFNVPSNWEVGGQADEKRMQQMLDVDPQYKVSALSVYGVAEGCAVIVYEIVIPTGEGDAYINKLHRLSTEKFRIGKSQGLVKQVLANKKTRLGMFNALLIDWESSRGDLPHIRQWILYTQQFPNNIPAIMAHCNSSGYKQIKMAIDRIASSFAPKQ